MEYVPAVLTRERRNWQLSMLQPLVQTPTPGMATAGSQLNKTARNVIREVVIAVDRPHGSGIDKCYIAARIADRVGRVVARARRPTCRCIPEILPPVHQRCILTENHRDSRP